MFLYDWFAVSFGDDEDEGFIDSSPRNRPRHSKCVVCMCLQLVAHLLIKILHAITCGSAELQESASRPGLAKN